MAIEAWAGTALASGHQAAGSSAFLARVTRDQTIFLDSFAEARRLLGHGGDAGSDPHLAQAAAMHARLTRQFFDAQRGLLRLRADADDQLAEINAAADLAPVIDSLEQALATRGGGLLAWDAAESQLGALLDGWWRIESDEAKAVVDDANARAAVRRHAACVEPAPEPSHHMLERELAEPIATVAVLDALESMMGTHALAGSGSADLDSVLASLMGMLESSPVTATEIGAELATTVAPAAATPPPVLPSPSVGDLRFVIPDEADHRQPSEPDAFDRFWGQRSSRRSQSRSFPQWLLAEVMLPITSVVALLVLVLAWIG